MRGLPVLAALGLGLPLLAQPWQFVDELAKAHLPKDTARAYAVALGDVDGDGDLDAVVDGPSGEYLYLNDGDARLRDATAGRLPQVAARSNALLLADLDGDGDLDLFAGHAGKQDRLLRNNGSGAFDDVTATSLPADTDFTEDAVASDVDGDGDLDLVSASSGGRQHRLYLNDGGGRFTDASARLSATTNSAYAAAAGDVDGDGDADLLFGNWLAPDTLYLNFGNGTFTLGPTPPARVPTLTPAAIELGDLDGDGDLDLAFGYQLGGAAVYLNLGGGAFETQSRLPLVPIQASDLELADIDGDRDLDVLVGTDNFGRTKGRLYRNDGPGQFIDVTAAQWPPLDNDAQGIAVGDLDADGDLDVLSANGSNSIPPAPVDFRTLALNDGAGTFVDATAGRVPVDIDRTLALAVGDVDGDGDPDVVKGIRRPYVEGVRAYHNDGRGHFTDAALPMPATFYSQVVRAVVLADVDRDGDLDVLACAESGTGSRVLLAHNDGSGVFTAAPSGHLPTAALNVHALASADFDGDGDDDLLLGTGGSTPLQEDALWLNDGAGTFTRAPLGALPVGALTRTRALAVGDVDGDGDLDAVRAGPGQNTLLLNTGAAVLFVAPPGSLPLAQDATEAVALGDLDGDGDLDLVLANLGEVNRIYLNDGAGRFSNAFGALTLAAELSYGLALADFDEDGSLDIAFANDGPNRLFLNDGSGGFEDASGRLQPHGEGSTALAAADLDGDGDRDLFVGNSSAGGPNGLGLPLDDRLYRNDHRQLTAALLARVGHRYPLAFTTTPGYDPSGVTVYPFVATRLAAIPQTLPGIGTLYLGGPLAALPVTQVAPGAASAELPLVLPRTPALLGLPLYAQALFVDATSGAARLSGFTADVVQR